MIYDGYELFTIHQYNIQTLCIESYKVYQNLQQTISSNLFTRNSNSYNLRSKTDFVILQIRTVLKESNSVRYYGPIIWSLVPQEIRYADAPEKMKRNGYPCRI